ncbi:hypothetical protein [Anaeromyxobacter sp. SG64]|uniref:hypothetical protein n=1 Tax=Anaeromyxobacter sp. SG64 TaxID=2925409 RepID=UPI001F5A0E2A|nr:hypothetical protein [Anaeromyxobacter sp. SG64]
MALAEDGTRSTPRLGSTQRTQRARMPGTLVMRDLQKREREHGPAEPTGRRRSRDLARLQDEMNRFDDRVVEAARARVA